MKSYMQLKELSGDILKELGNIGSGNAVTSLSQMMNLPVEIEVPDLQVVTYQEIYSILSEAEALQTGIMVEIFGEVNGMFLFLMDEVFTDMVLNTILGEQERDLLKLDDMETSLINELGNIMCGSYIRALSQLMNLEIDVSVPNLSIDMGGAILSSALSHFLRVSEDILVIENRFRLDQCSYMGRILFLPELEALHGMLQKLEE